MKFLELDQRVRLVFEKFPADFQYLNSDSFQSPKLNPYSLFSLHSLYRLCSCTLHSSIIPLFSNNSTNRHIPKKFSRWSVEESVRHTESILDMATAFLATRPDTSRIPSFSGYSLFVACSIYFKCLVAQRKLHIQDMSRFKAAISILRNIKEYWAVIQGLVRTSPTSLSVTANNNSGIR